LLRSGRHAAEDGPAAAVAAGLKREKGKRPAAGLLGCWAEKGKGIG
jgi:hypothetical protein